MAEDKDKNNLSISTSKNLSVPKNINITDLNNESKNILNQLIAENDLEKTKALTNLFNINQNKKTLVRVDKLSELLDVITDQTLTRFTLRPDEISNQELFQGLKTVADLIEKGQKQAAATEPLPLIQINQQNNEVNLNGDSLEATKTLSRDSRENIKNAVLKILNLATTENSIKQNTIEINPVDKDNNDSDDPEPENSSEKEDEDELIETDSEEFLEDEDRNDAE